MIKSLIGATLLTMGVGATTPTPFYLNADQNTQTSVVLGTKNNNNTYEDTTLNMNVNQTLTIQNNQTKLTQNSKVNTSYWYIENLPLKNISAIDNDKLVNEGFNYNLDNTDVFYFKYKPNDVMNNNTINITLQPNISSRRGTAIQSANLLVRFSVLIGNNSLQTLYEKWNNQSLNQEDLNKQRIYDLNQYQSRYATTETIYKNVVYVPYLQDSVYYFNAQTIEIETQNLAYQQDNYIFVSAYYYWYSNYTTESIWSTMPRINSDNISTNTATMGTYQEISINYYQGTSTNINYEVINIPDLIFTILTTPFAFMSQAFNFTLFPGTQYALNISNLLLAIIGILVFIFVIKFFVKRV